MRLSSTWKKEFAFFEFSPWPHCVSAAGVEEGVIAPFSTLIIGGYRNDSTRPIDVREFV